MDIGEDITIKPVNKKTNKIQSGKYLDSMRRERVFRCYRVCETMEDYKKGI